jgi:hypothetical protein
MSLARWVQRSLEHVAPHAQRALDLLEQWVEHGVPAPAGQCIPRGGSIVAAPHSIGRPEHCATLIAP